MGKEEELGFLMFEIVKDEFDTGIEIDRIPGDKPLFLSLTVFEENPPVLNVGPHE